MDYQEAYWNLVEHYMALLEKYASLHEKIYGASRERSIDLKIIGGQNQEAYWNLFDHYMALLERYASLQKKLNRLNPAEVRISLNVTCSRSKAQKKKHTDICL